MGNFCNENGVVINIENTLSSARKNEVVYNPGIQINRCLTFCALSSYIESKTCINKHVRCLDALGATGIAGLSWAKNFKEVVEVTINGHSENACKRILENANANELKVEITQSDVSILAHQRPFDFVYLDCYGSSVQYLEAIFRHLPKNGLLVINSTDDAALFGKAPDVTIRNYGGHVIKTFYAKELAARLIIASVTREAARCNKGIEVLAAIAVKSHITVIVRVLRGPAVATQCVHKIQKVLHCCICEDRAFYPRTVHPIENPYSMLSCDCRSRSTGQVAVELGPVWSGSIFESNFCSAMLRHAISSSQPQKLINLLQTVVTEGLGGVPVEKLREIEVAKAEPVFGKDPQGGYAGEGSTVFGSPPKKTRINNQCLPFYFNLHRHSPKGYDLGKLNKIVSYLRASGQNASRTHFDSEAIRTSATLKEFNELLIQFSKSALI